MILKKNNTKAERLRQRNYLYSYALGLLSLRHADLWEITNGELNDLIQANEYKLFRQRQDMAVNTVVIANLLSKNKISIQDLTGIYYNGKIYNKHEFLDMRLGARNED